jgi:hypothetical protein
MNTFLLCAGVHGDERGLDYLQRIVENRRPAGILFAGGVLPTARCYEPRTTLWGLTRPDARFVERFFQTLGRLNVFSAVIPGTDAPMEEFLQMGMHAEVEFANVHLAHATLVSRNGLAVIGLGGWVSEGTACEIDCCPRTLARYYLRSLATATQPNTVLLLARSPASSVGGSLLSAELIDTLHPHLCVVGDGHEGPGVRRVARTLVVNPGSLAEGRAAWLDLRRRAEDRVELLDQSAGRPVAVTPGSAS